MNPEPNSSAGYEKDLEDSVVDRKERTRAVESQGNEKTPVEDTTVLPFYKSQKVKSVEISETDEAILENFQPEQFEDGPNFFERLWVKYRIVGHLAVAGVILGWWISSIVMKSTRHRWIQSTILSWFFILLTLSRWLPISWCSRTISRIWEPTVSKPFFSLPYHVRLGFGILALTALVFGTAFGQSLPAGTSYGDRARSVFGLLVMWGAIGACSRDLRRVQWETVIVGFSFQFIMALLVFKTKAFHDVFQWISYLAEDFLKQAQAGATFFFGATLADEELFFISTLSAIIFFVAFVQLLYYYGIMQWLIKKFAWFFFKTLNISGVESVVAASSPFIGQGESAILVKPYVMAMTSSEIHQTMTSGFATIAGSVLAAYINLGMPSTYLVTSSVMSIPAAIAISKLRWPETGEPVTRGRVVVARDKDGATSGLHAFSNGAWFGLRVAGLILANVLTILSLISAIDGLLTWIGKAWGIHHLTLELLMGYIFYPVAWLLGVPKVDMLRSARLMGIKLIANEFVAYSDLQPIISEFTPRGFTITVFSLCGFANLGSLGIQIGVLTSLAQNQQRVITRVGPSALICGYIATLTSASIAGMLM